MDKSIELVIRCRIMPSVKQRIAIYQAKGTKGHRTPNSFTWVTIIIESEVDLGRMLGEWVYCADRIVVNGEVFKDRNGNRNPIAGENSMVCQ